MKAQPARFTLNSKGYYEAPGADILSFSNANSGLFADAKISGVEIIQRDMRSVTNGDVRLSATPGQWDPSANLVNRRIDQATADRLNAVRARGNRVIAVGTTSLRLIESAADEAGIVHAFEGDTAIFITPGYRFKGIDGLMTNFHLPKSTLFMLVSALMGLDRMQAAYAHAIVEHYRFYSYGDASLLLPDRDR